MRMREIVCEEGQPVTVWGAGWFRLPHGTVRGSLLMAGDRYASWDISSIERLDAAAMLAALSALASPASGTAFDLLIIGVGARGKRLPDHAAVFLTQSAIPYEAMPSDSACRVWNMLLPDGRRLAAALVAS